MVMACLAQNKPDSPKMPRCVFRPIMGWAQARTGAFRCAGNDSFLPARVFLSPFPPSRVAQTEKARPRRYGRLPLRPEGWGLASPARGSEVSRCSPSPQTTDSNRESFLGAVLEAETARQGGWAAAWAYGEGGHS